MQALKVNRRNGHSARRLRWTRGGLSLFSLIIVLSMVLAAPGGGALAAGPTVQAQDGTVLPETPQAPEAITATYTETNSVSGTIPDGSSGPPVQSGCAYWPATRYFLVDEYYTINDLNIRLNVSHNSRGQLKVILTSPAGTQREIVSTNASTSNDYDILLDGDSGGALDDGSNDDTTGAVDRTVLQALLNNFEGESAHGAWKMTICDNTQDGTGGTFNTATTLTFDGTAYTPVPYNHVQGPSIVETYYVPFPEDQLWTAMNTIFPGSGTTVGSDSCVNYASYDGVPRQPFVNYIGVTVPTANTVIAYDQWEDGYEADLTYPSQTTTQVWGDGNLLNGVAPKDADDVLVAGQILVLDDVMLTTSLQTIIDFDARDKIGASQPIAVTRSGWSDGSQTLFASADEVYPTSNWGIEYRLPVGEDFDVNYMFEYTGVSVLAAVDGTVVSIDKNADGTAEQTCNLNQGGTCQWDDPYTNGAIGAGLNRGTKITSNSGHPIQVSLLTGDYCAGFATRSYTLLPVDQWDNTYYSPVGTITSAGGPQNDDAPTTVHVYNPNASVITLNYIMGSGGSVQTATIGPRLGTNITETNLMGAIFYSSSASAGSYTAQDNFGSQAFDNSDGTMPWSTDWDETGDDDSATAGDIQINTNLRFYTGNSSSLASTIDRQVNLSGATAATLAFSWNHNSAESGDNVIVEASSNGGSSWSQVGSVINGGTSGNFSQSILGYASANTRIRFRVSARTSTSQTSEYIYVDGVTVTVTFPGAASALNFYAVASVDSDAKGTAPNLSSAYDWGFTLVPKKVMSQALIVGWAPGDDPTFLGTATENTAPIWLTGGNPDGSANTFDICIDDGGDNVGANNDPVTTKNYDRKIASIAPRSQQKIYYGGAQVGGQDQTGTQIWVCGPTTTTPSSPIGSDAPNAPDATVLNTNAIITAAWGEDPLTAQAGKPGLDMGFTIRNLRSWRAAKSAALLVDQNGNGLYDEGDKIRYTITVANTGAAQVSLKVTDTNPTNVTYVNSSTYLNGATPITDGVSTPFPLDDEGGGVGGYTYNNLPAFSSFTILYDVTINAGAGGTSGGTVTNTAHVTDTVLTLNPDVTVTVQAPRTGDIGNYVWLDEDGDGDQDAGEAGIPNAKVQLCSDAACTTILATTYTDANGGYLFPDRNAGTYYVKVTPPSGLNQTYDENGALDNTSQVVLTPGQEYLTADFGYNWSTPTETNNPVLGSTGAIGDKLWVDVDGDGVQDAEEVGIAGVSVQLTNLGPDGVLGTGDDVVTSTTTNANGSYIFDGLSAGSYVVTIPTPPAGFTQTGDPDHFGTTGTNDNKTTTPIVLGPGDVFANADFGYQPTAGTTGSIGDTLWLDADRAGDIDAAEPRLPGVTVSLIKDTNSDGAWDPDGVDNILGNSDDEVILATDVTDATGQYLFSGLPAGGGQDYLVWVNDANNVLGDLVPTYDSNGTGTANLSPVTNLTTGGNLLQDFGYAPTGHDAGEGLIGDTVFLDRDASGTFNPGEGLEGVLVKLFAADGTTLVAVTTTNENGQYFFGGLPAATYVVQVQTGTLPYAGLSNTVDPDGGNNSTSTVAIAAGGINLLQDFGYRDTSSPNTIGGTIWNDLNANGTLVGADETGRFQGVTVVLRNASGNIVATTTTLADGSYSFTNLPDGTYTVDVTDDANVLNGYWKSTGTNPGADNNSQLDPYTVSVTGGQNNTTADFGYYQQPAALGNFVWEDLDADGVQDAGEPGIPGVPVTLTITWPNSSGTTTLKTTTDASGFYSFANLLQDEDYPASGGAGQPTLSVSITAPTGYASSPQNATTEDRDSDNPAGEPAAATKGSANNIYDFGLLRNGTIGNYVWLDEDGDGDQDAGEAGIPNATVQLCADAACTTVLKTTTTDANGGYLFTDVPRGSYYVKVTPPAGLNPTYDENGGLDNVSQVVLTGSGQEYLTADFGYNWSTPTETNNPSAGATGAIGDKIWVDVDGDGIQDAEEVGIAGVTVQLTNLGPDGVLGTGDDVVTSTTTNANGSYIFDGLSAGSYVVTIPTPPAGFTQTGDPDHFGTTGTNDNKTTTPIVLGPGDVFVNADFGYQPTAGTTGSIGDTLWLDADRAGDIDAAEPRLPGVTVSLIKDTNGDGAWDPDGVDNILGNGDDEVIIATDVTDATGQYLFSGLPAGGGQDYLVWVNDTNSVLGGLVPTYDSNGTGTPNLSPVTDLTTGGNLLQDFGYAPAGHDAGEGLIGDTIFLDRDSSGTFNPGEGLEGVRVGLYDSTGTILLAVTTTNENGQYFFGNLSPTATYVVKVDTTTLPLGVTNTVDPDGGTANQSSVNLATTGPVNLLQDFGYRDTSSPNTISGTIWKDTNADGSLVGGEAGRFAGVTVVLYDNNGNVVATTTTDASGNYSFSNLPDGTYKVDVTDDANVLNGYWKSTGPSAGSDNNSQVDPYTVSVSGGQNNTTADFGYYQQPAALGNFVWEDLDGDGIQDAGEPGIPGVPVTLTVTWPNSSGTTTLKTTTDASGFYSFANLLQDEDYPASGGAGQPTLSVSITAPAGYASSPQNATTEDLDSDNPAGEPAAATKGSANNIYDFGLVRNGTIGNYVWLDEDGDGDQDAGEAGIPNAAVQLCADAACTTVLKTTTTDANGGYLFTDVPRGSYYVKVTPPAGLNPTYDENGGLDNISTVTLTSSGQEYLTADFGYNWSTPTETNNPGPGATGAIGDKIWVDVDGDGVQDPEEVGIPGVTVQLTNLGADGLLGTGDDTVITTTTNANGNYVFDNLPAGAYVVSIPTPPAEYTQTGDPDQFGLPCTTCDNQTSAPIVLAPGDVFVNIDFGYKPETPAGSIGDTVWFDANANGTQDGGEYGIPGVTVSLIKDVGTIGVYEPGIDLIIATDFTDANGQYLFNGLPATGVEDYLVWVNDTDNVLGSLVPTYDATAPANGISSVQNLTTAPVTNQDFGFAPLGQTTGEGLIGDTIFLDRDLGGDYDAGEGLEGVIVRLYSDTNGDGNYDAGEPLLAVTATDENGNYAFANLPAGNYVVAVVTSSLPGALTNTVDPGGIGPLNESGVTLATGEINLTQDFGYTGGSSIPGTIGNLIWNDANANGVVDGGEMGIAGVTVDLYWDSNGNGVLDASDKLVGTTTTNPAGGYNFYNLGVDDGGGDINYFIDVTDTANVLNGYWHSSGTANVNNNSQADPYLVNMNGATRDNDTADFGYYQKPAALGNWVWVDDGDGIQESGELPIVDWPVTLTITYPNGVVVTLQTTTDANGFYNFANLLQDEDYDGAGAGEPTFTITIPIPTDGAPSPVNQGGNDALDSDGTTSGSNVTASVTAGNPLVKGATNPDYDFGFVLSPTNLTVSDPYASVANQTIEVNWQTYSEMDILGFSLYRAVDPNAVPADRSLVMGPTPAKHPGKPLSDTYQYVDSDVQPGVSYTYWLVVQMKDGTSWTMQPTTAGLPEFEKKVFLPSIRR